MFNAVAAVHVALDSISQMCDKSAVIVSTKTFGTTVDANGTTHDFDRVGNTYVRRAWVPKDGVFLRPKL